MEEELEETDDDDVPEEAVRVTAQAYGPPGQPGFCYAIALSTILLF